MATMLQALVFKVTQLDKTSSKPCSFSSWLVIRATWYDLKQISLIYFRLTHSESQELLP